MSRSKVMCSLPQSNRLRCALLNMLNYGHRSRISRFTYHFNNCGFFELSYVPCLSHAREIRVFYIIA